jgi:hypothetical protein
MPSTVGLGQTSQEARGSPHCTGHLATNEVGELVLPGAERRGTEGGSQPVTLSLSGFGEPLVHPAFLTLVRRRDAPRLPPTPPGP